MLNKNSEGLKRLIIISQILAVIFFLFYAESDYRPERDFYGNTKNEDDMIAIAYQSTPGWGLLILMT